MRVQARENIRESLEKEYKDFSGFGSWSWNYPALCVCVTAKANKEPRQIGEPGASPTIVYQGCLHYKINKVLQILLYWQT